MAIVLTTAETPIEILHSNFDPIARRSNTVVVVPETGFPWNWTARAYVLEEESVEPAFASSRRLIGPLWPHSGADIATRFEPVEPTSSLEAVFRDFMVSQAGMVFLQPELQPGYYYPRIWRGGYIHRERQLTTWPLVTETPYFESFVGAIRRFDSLALALNALFRTIYPTRANLWAYGDEIRNVILLAATEAEAQWRAILKANGQNKERLTTNDFVKLVQPMRLSEYECSLRDYPDFVQLETDESWAKRGHLGERRESNIIRPFEGWEARAPTETLPWYDAYNAVKHNAEGRQAHATLGNALAAVAGVYTLLAAQFGLSTVVAHSRDRTIQVRNSPQWQPQHWYYEPPPRVSWKIAQFPFC